MSKIKAVKAVDRPDIVGKDLLKDQQTSIQHRYFIIGLIAALVVLIVIVNAIRTDASLLGDPIDTQPTSEITIRQLDSVLIAESTAGLIVGWRVVQTDGILCNQSVFESSQSTISNDNMVLLAEDDSGKRYCFEASISTRTFIYQLSPPIADFEFITLDTEQSLSIISIEIHDGVLLARASRSAYWRVISSAAAEECTLAGFANIPAEDSRFSVVTYIPYEELENDYYCFQAYDYLDRAFRALPAD